MSIVVNESGDILAIGPPEGTRGDQDPGAPSHAFEALEGQRVVHAELPDDLTTEDKILRLFRTHRLSDGSGQPSFVARS